MTITSTNRTDLSYIEEVTPGTTPATPAFQLLPTTGGAPRANITTAVSQVIRSDRATDDLIPVDSDIMADAINFELAYTPYKPLLQALLQQNTAVTAAVTDETDLSVTAATRTIASSTTDFVASGIRAGRIIKIAGFANAANNGYFFVQSVSANELIVSKRNMTDEAAGEAVSISGTSYANGVNTPKSYSFCKRIQGIDNTAYFYYRGMQISQFVLNYQLGQLLGGNFGLVGLEEDPTETPITGQSFTPIPSYTVMSPATSMGLSELFVSSLSANPRFEQVNLTINNNINAAKQIGTLGAADLASFTLDVTGDIRVYFENIAQYNLFRNATEFALSLLSQDAAGNAFGVSLPRCKFETLEPPIEGKDNFLMLNGTLRALHDSTAQAMVVFNFFDAA